MDMNLTDTQRLQFRRMNYAFWEYQPLDGSLGITPKFFNRPNQTNSLSYVYTISPTMVSEALATVSLDDVYIPVDTPNYFDRTKAGINYPYIFPQGKLIPTRIPTVNMNNFASLNGGPYPSHSAGPIYNISEKLTWIKGSHTFKFGYLYEKSGENDNDEINVSACPTCTNNQNGQFQFTDTRSGLPTSGTAIANVALGLFDTYSELGQRAYTIFRGSMHEMFVNDSWKASQKLHIDLGVRYTINIPYSALWRNMAVFDPSFYDPAKAVTVVGTGPRRARSFRTRVTATTASPSRARASPIRPRAASPKPPIPRCSTCSAAPTPTTRIFSTTPSSRASASLTRSTTRPSSAPARAASSPAWA